MDSTTAKRNLRASGFHRLSPNLDAEKITRPRQTEMMLAMCNVAQYAYGAYKNPGVAGFTEHTCRGEQVNHLNYDLTNDAVDGVLKIHLKEAKNVPDADFGWWNYSDPYVSFSHGMTVVKSEVRRDSKNPVWNSIHYVVIRTNQLRTTYSQKLQVALYDDDSHESSNMLINMVSQLNKDDFLGSEELDLEELKKEGVHTFDISLTNSRESKRMGTTLSFTVEHISVRQACEENGIDRVRPDWIRSIGTADDSPTYLTDISWIVEFGHLTMDPLAFITSPCTGTQVWIHVNRQARTLLIAFRGTESSQTRDLLIDIRTACTSPRATASDTYALRATDALKNEDISVHKGFLTAYESIRESLLQVIYDITGWTEDWSICVTGHSLGGALATLCSFECANRKNENGTGPQIGMMNFGAPRVGNSTFARLCNETVHDNFRVVDKDDVVHLVPMLYVHSGREVLCLPDGDVFVGGLPLDKIDSGVFTINSRETDIATIESASLKSLLKQYAFRFGAMAENHYLSRYFGNIRAAVHKFFGAATALQNETLENQAILENQV